MFTEISFRRCFINGKKSGIASYSDNSNRVLFFSQSLGSGDGSLDAVRFAGVSLHQFNNSMLIPSADAAGVAAVIPGAVIDWEGSAEYNARVAAAAGSRGGSASGASSASASSAPAVSAGAASEVSTSATTPAEGVELPAVDASECLNTALSAAVGGLAPMVAGAILPAVNNWAAGLVDEAVKSAGASASSVDLIRVQFPNEVREIEGKAHAQLAKVVNLLNAGINVYLYGPAGTGKTHLCKQAAAALGVEFYSDQKICNEFQITGFVDASGKYQETEFYRAFTRGGLYMLDEFDASDPCAAVVLNLALANGYFTFPGVGRVDAHENFRVIAAGNTIGRGATMEYEGRNCLDGATLDRFAVLPVGYDPEIELAKANNDQDLINFIHEVRRAASACGVQVIASYRAIANITKMHGMFSAAECLSMLLIKGIEKDQIKLLASECRGRGVWFDALNEIAA
ncbi:MAG: AAA family ATPase [Muribaculaceae bacterium]|nr:AAA family ATPase [Muribaculaceae bacterium]